MAAWVLAACSSVINSAQAQLNIFDIFPGAEWTVTAEGETNHPVTLSLSADCRAQKSCSWFSLSLSFPPL